MVFYNSLSHSRTALVRVYVSHPQVEVRDPTGEVLLSQVDPYWITNEDMSSTLFKVCVIV